MLLILTRADFSTTRQSEPIRKQEKQLNRKGAKIAKVMQEQKEKNQTAETHTMTSPP
jgi:hypothetical protein